MPEPSWLDFVWFYKDKVQFLFYGLLFLYCLVRKAAAPETILSGVLFAMLAGDKIHHFVLDGSIIWREANIGHVAIDLLVMACTFTVALHANRVYPLWIAGAQIISLFGHAYRLGLREINTFAYDVMAVTPSYVQFLAISMGIACHMSRRRRLGSYPSWRRSLRPTQERAGTTSPGG